MEIWVNTIGQVMGLKTIAAFTKNQAIVDLLTNMGVDYAQGYGVGSPEPLLSV